MLKPVLLANAASCAIFGLIFVFLGSETAELIGSPPVFLLQILGVGLIANAGLLIAVSIQREPARHPILMFALGDGLWVITTIVLLLSGIWITTTAGVIWAICVAMFVGACGLLQWRYAPK